MAFQLPDIVSADISPGQKVFVRIDCNVPLNADGSIADAFRLEAVTPTLEYLRDKGVKVILAGALGRPKGKKVDGLTTQCIANYFDEKVFENCMYINEAFGDQVEEVIDSMANGDCVVLENLRFWAEEEANDEQFAKNLAGLADCYVNDAFGQCHREQASIVAITKFLPSFAGICLQQEVRALESVLNVGEKPVVAIIGGAKVSDKLGVIEALLDRADTILIGGAMAYTFLKGQGVKIGNSLCENDFVEKSADWMKTGKIILPKDSIVADTIESTETTTASEIPNGFAGFDIGQASIEKFSQEIANAQTILWNGPMGVFEKQQFAKGTSEIAKAVATSSAFSVVGGGDSVAAIRSLKLESQIDHVSTGGGATLEYLEKGTLVGIDALVNLS